MSLTTLLKKPEVREKFKAEFIKPKFSLNATTYIEAKNPSQSHATLVGTAFDYALRVYVSTINSNVWAGKLVAEHAVDQLQRALSTKQPIFPPGSKRSLRGLLKLAENTVEEAIDEFDRCQNSGIVTENALKSTIQLAKLEQFYRCGQLTEDFGEENDEATIDLNSLLHLAKSQNVSAFSASKVCVLNPDFREASFLVGGADADLLIDETLIEVKTVKKLTYTSDIFLQLMGYYTLYKIGGGVSAGVRPKPSIANIAVYFSRFGLFVSTPIDKIVNPETFPTFVRWFKNYVKLA